MNQKLQLFLSVTILTFCAGCFAQTTIEGVPDDEYVPGEKEGVTATSLIDYTCKGKAIVAQFAIQNRDTMSEQDVLDILEQDWEEQYKPNGVKHASYVDMQRIVRDLFRSHKGEFNKQFDGLEAKKMYVRREAMACYAQGF